MNKELKDILSGKTELKMEVVDYSTPKKQKELKALMKKKQDILKRKEVDWQRLNSFVISK